MTQCQNCGQTNAAESQFCRFCGTKFVVQQPMPQQQDFQSRRPYSWKTDEYQTQSDARRYPPPQGGAGPLSAREPQFVEGIYRCPHCMSQFLPKIERRISTTGWIVFGILLVVFLPLFWIGLLIKEDVHICPSCNTRVKYSVYR